ncbi:MAG: 2-dehydropantoate 2-reductase [Beijerinckiaceae bacterium]|jgi:2-dehydropantoate 2-reductase|nr:2-dehydropantoate 2-reductase [Beijerinckiaceae bacterium]
MSGAIETISELKVDCNKNVSVYISISSVRKTPFDGGTDARTEVSMAKILIAGAGALGSLFGGLLAEGGHDVTLFTRRRDHVEAVRSKGLRIIEEGASRIVAIAATDNPQDIEPPDLAIVLAKSTATQVICRQLAPSIHAGTTCISFQNGLGNEEIITAEWPTGQILGGITSMGATLETAGQVRSYGRLPSLIGALGARLSDRANSLVALFTASGLPATATDRFWEAKWQKLLMNVAMSGTSALTGLTIGGVAAMPSLAAIAGRALEEAAAVASAGGVTLAPQAQRALLDGIVSSGAARNKTSMRRDLEAGRPTEVEAIYGRIIDRAQRAGIPVPTLETLAALIEGFEHAMLAGGEP